MEQGDPRWREWSDAWPREDWALMADIMQRVLDSDGDIRRSCRRSCPLYVPIAPAEARGGGLWHDKVRRQNLMGTGVTLLTEEEFLSLPASSGKQEFRDGELIEVPPAKYVHSELIKRLVRLLETVLHESRVWSETGFLLRKGRWVSPDVCVIWPDQPRQDGWFQRSPMLVIEVASRGNTPDQLQQKVMDYLETGVGEVCVIYPKSKTMVVFRPGSVLNISADTDYHCDIAGVTFTPDYRTEVPN
jgi:Uma2 family endonuclease